jgi:hypothetical protein
MGFVGGKGKGKGKGMQRVATEYFAEIERIRMVIAYKVRGRKVVLVL